MICAWHIYYEYIKKSGKLNFPGFFVEGGDRGYSIINLEVVDFSPSIYLMI
jgi:hypothetical protein